MSSDMANSFSFASLDGAETVATGGLSAIEEAGVKFEVGNMNGNRGFVSSLLAQGPVARSTERSL